MLPLIFTLAVLTPPPAPPDGTYTYAVTMNGATVGKNAIAVKRDASGAIVLTENGSGSMNGQSGAIQDTLTLDSTLAPESYNAVASLGDSKGMKSNLSFKDGQALQTDDVNKKYSLAADAKHFVLMDFGPFTGFFALPAQMQAWNSAPVIALVPMYGQGFPMTLDAAAKPARPASVPAVDLPMTFSSMVQLTVWYDPSTMVVDEVDVPSQGVTVKRTS